MKTTFDQYWEIVKQPYTEMGYEKAIVLEIWLAARSNKVVETLTEEIVWN